MIEHSQEREHRGASVVRERRPWWRSAWVLAPVCLVVCLAGAVAILALYVEDHAEPILRANLVRTLSERFHAPVELDSLHVSVLKGLEVRGEGLRISALPTQPIPSGATPANLPPLLTVKTFAFRTSLLDLLQRRVRISSVRVSGMEIHVPPHTLGTAPRPPTDRESLGRPKLSFVVGHIVCERTVLFIETTKPGKDALEFQIPHLELTDVAAGQPLIYVADVINPKPTGNVHAFGHFGPWKGEDPRSTRVDGEYRFDHADLNTIKGLGGILSSTGRYSGQLDHIMIDGTTDTPRFSIDVSNHPMPLETRFHAFVDGTTGDTTLAPVQARLGRSEFTAAGAIVRVHGKGHDIALTITMPRGRIEDMLQAGMKTEPPVMRGTVTMHAKLHIPPSGNAGQGRRNLPVASRMQLAGNLSIDGVEFSNAKLQDRIDGMSMRAQGRPGEVKTAGSDRKPEVVSGMRVDFSLGQALMTVHSLNYEIPGAKVTLHGVYSLDGNIFEFKGHVRTDAKASQMVTGWKSMLLKAVDPFLAKNGAGMELPVSISGVQGDMRFGLASNANESTADMAADVRARRQAETRQQRANRPSGQPAPKP